MGKYILKTYFLVFPLFLQMESTTIVRAYFVKGNPASYTCYREYQNISQKREVIAGHWLGQAGLAGQF